MKPELYIPRQISRSSFATNPTPQARLYKTGLIMLNPAAVTLLRAIEADYTFVLYFYRDLGQIGIRAVRSGDPAAAGYVGKQNPKNGSVRIWAKGIFVHYGVNLEAAAGLVTIGYDDQNGLAVIPLPKGSCPVMVDSSAARARLRQAGQRASVA